MEIKKIIFSTLLAYSVFTLSNVISQRNEQVYLDYIPLYSFKSNLFSFCFIPKPKKNDELTVAPSSSV